jgi:hypothetical protein
MRGLSVVSVEFVVSLVVSLVVDSVVVVEGAI